MFRRSNFEDIHMNERRWNRRQTNYSLHNQNPYEREGSSCRWVMEHMPKTYSKEKNHCRKLGYENEPSIIDVGIIYRMNGPNLLERLLFVFIFQSQNGQSTRLKGQSESIVLKTKAIRPIRTLERKGRCDEISSTTGL